MAYSYGCRDRARSQQARDLAQPLRPEIEVMTARDQRAVPFLDKKFGDIVLANAALPLPQQGFEGGEIPDSRVRHPLAKRRIDQWIPDIQVFAKVLWMERGRGRQTEFTRCQFRRKV